MNNIFYIAGWVFLAIFFIIFIGIFGAIFLSSQKAKKEKEATNPKAAQAIADPAEIKFSSVGANKKRSLLIDPKSKKKTSKAQLADNVFGETPTGFAPRNPDTVVPNKTAMPSSENQTSIFDELNEPEAELPPFSIDEESAVTSLPVSNLPAPPPSLSSAKPISAPFAIRRAPEEGTDSEATKRPLLPPPPPSFGR